MSEAGNLVFQWIFVLNSVKHNVFHASIVKVRKKCYSQTSLEGCKYEIKKTKKKKKEQKRIKKNLINDELEASSSDDETVSDSDNDHENEFANKP